MKKFCVLSLIALMLSACNAGSDQKEVSIILPDEIIDLESVVTDYGHGVVYFKGEKTFAQYLSVFLASHPGLEVITVIPDYYTHYDLQGYTVIFKGSTIAIDESLIASELPSEN